MIVVQPSSAPPAAAEEDSGNVVSLQARLSCSVLLPLSDRSSNSTALELCRSNTHSLTFKDFLVVTASYRGHRRKPSRLGGGGSLLSVPPC